MAEIVWGKGRGSLWDIVRNRTRRDYPEILEAIKIAKGIKDNVAAQAYLQSLYNKSVIHYGGNTGLEWDKWMTKVINPFMDVFKREKRWKEQSAVAAGGSRRGAVLTGGQGIRGGATILGGMREKLGE